MFCLGLGFIQLSCYLFKKAGTLIEKHFIVQQKTKFFVLTRFFITC